MEIKIDPNGLIIAYAIVGELDGGTTTTAQLPDNFVNEFQPNKFKLIGNQISENTDYVEPVAPVPEVTHTAEQQAITALAQQTADQQAHIASLEQALTALAQGGTK